MGAPVVDSDDCAGTLLIGDRLANRDRSLLPSLSYSRDPSYLFADPCNPIAIISVKMGSYI